MNKANTSVFRIEYYIPGTNTWVDCYFDDGYTAKINIRAFDAAEAKRICKKLTGALIKNQRVISAMGCGFRAAND